MGFFSNLFKSKEQRELEAIYEKIELLLNSDEAQNKLIPEHFKSMYDQRPMNKVSGAKGDFGRDISNPIPVNGTLGEITYLSSLLVESTGEKVFFHRLGSCANNIDIFELISISGNFYDVLYLDMYHTHKSKIVPKGYISQQKIVCIRGIHNFYRDFPVNFKDALINGTRNAIGFPCFDPDVKNIDIGRALYTIAMHSRSKCH